MTPEQKSSWARQAIENPVLMAILEDVENQAVSIIAFAPANAHDTRQSKAAEIRAARDVRSRLKAIAEPVTAQTVKSIA